MTRQQYVATIFSQVPDLFLLVPHWEWLIREQKTVPFRVQSHFSIRIPIRLRVLPFLVSNWLPWQRAARRFLLTSTSHRTFLI